MKFQSQKMQLVSIRLVLRNEINEVHVCRNLIDKSGGLYTVVYVKDHSYVRRFLTVCEQTEKDSDFFVDCFSDGENQVIVFPYVKERSLKDFYRPDMLTLSECEDICINTIIACMSSNLPWPILQLILAQEQLHLSRDGSVYLGYFIDLKDLDINATEKDCTVRCATILLDLLRPKEGRQANSLKLLEKKVGKASYTRFVELYKDIRISAVPKEKVGFIRRFLRRIFRNKDGLFKLLLRISVILALFVVLSFLSQLIFGDVPWLRLFINSFDKIGTESLLQ